MNLNRRRDFPQPFEVRRWGEDAWCLQSAPPAVQIWVRGAAPAAVALLGGGRCEALSVEWRAGRVRVYVTTTTTLRRVFEARFAVVHESAPRLYEALPLAGFDQAAQRFWWRVFRLVRLPGGRLLLRLLARRRGASG